MRSKQFSIIAILIISIMLVAGCINDSNDDDTSPQVEIVYMSGCGTMPSALANNQLDAYIAWQPLVSVAEVGNIGKVIAYSEELPPEGKWENHPCCALITSNSFANNNYDVAKYLTMLMIVADQYIQENPISSAHYCADWLFGGGDLTFGNITVDSKEVEEASIQTIKFVSEPSEKWINDVVSFVHSVEEVGLVTDKLAGLDDAAIKDAIFYLDIYNDAKEELNTMNYLSQDLSTNNVANVAFGYLPSDHDAPLFVAAYDWEYFKDTYGIYLYPIKPGANGEYKLIVNENEVARIQLIEFAAGSAAMTAASQGNVDYCIIGVPPAILFMDQGSPVKIISPLQTEGSGVVVPIDAPFDDWDGFVDWINEMHKQGKTVKIGDPMIGSIQDIMLKIALKESGIEIK